MPFYDMELVVSSRELFYRYLFAVLENIVERFRGEAGKDYADALCDGAGDVCFGDDIFVAGEVGASVLYCDIFAAGAFYLERERFFKPEMAGRGKLVFHKNLENSIYSGVSFFDR